MDLLSHGLWAGAASKGVNLKKPLQLNYWWAFWWGIFPDAFAFLVPTAWMWIERMQGTPAYNWRERAIAEPPADGGYPPIMLAESLYNLSHSIVIFAAVAGIIWFIRKRPPYILLGWPLHILADIPTHTYQFFPTPVFWPISSWKFSGFQWSTPWFMALNYGLLFLVYVYLWYRRKKVER
jgi:hypothetical protein